MLAKRLRPSYRYLAIAIESWPDQSLTETEVERAINESARSLLGDRGVAEIHATLLQFAFENGSGEALVRVPRNSVKEARAAIACLSSIDNQPVRLHIRGISGTIRTCEEKYLGERPIQSGERTVAYDGTQRSAHVHNDRVDVRVNDAFVGAMDLDLE